MTGLPHRDLHVLKVDDLRKKRTKETGEAYKIAFAKLTHLENEPCSVEEWLTETGREEDFLSTPHLFWTLEN